MLPAHLQELLTAAVDGELTPAERRLVDKLLLDSEEAKVFHTQLQANAIRLRQLPKVTPVDDLAASVMNVIADRAMRPTPLPMPRRKPAWDIQRVLPWISMATAAGVILVVSLFSYMYFVASAQHQQLANQKLNDDKVVDTTITPPNKNLATSDKPKTPANHFDNGVHNEDRRPLIVGNEGSPPNKQMAPGRNEMEKLDYPREFVPKTVRPEDVPAAPAQPENEPFRLIQDIRLSLILPLKDLDQPYPKQKLHDELKKDEVVRIDLFCKDGLRSSELVQNSLKSRGQQILVDGYVQDRLKKKLKGEFVFFTESMTADEIAQLLEQLGAEDKKADAKKPSDAQFDKFVLAPFSPIDLNELAKLLGVSPAVIKLPKAKTVGVVDPRKSLESLTASQLAANLPKAASRGNEKWTLLLPFGAGNFFPQSSKEVKQFLEKRGDRKPSAVPMMLVLRTVN